ARNVTGVQTCALPICFELRGHRLQLAIVAVLSSLDECWDGIGRGSVVDRNAVDDSLYVSERQRTIVKPLLGVLIEQFGPMDRARSEERRGGTAWRAGG